jgi:hypothetical protein
MIGGTPDPSTLPLLLTTFLLRRPLLKKEPLIVGQRDNGKLTLWEGNFRAVRAAPPRDKPMRVLRSVASTALPPPY